MRATIVVLSLVVAACSATSSDHAESSTTLPAPVQLSSRPQPVVADSAEGLFTGLWQDCDAGASSDECSQYQLVQRGERICGVWSYVATGAGYEGRVVARAVSSTDARRTRVCGRPGSETRTECDSGWESIDKPLRLCDGKLSESEVANDECRARYERAPGADAQLMALANEPWMQECLAGQGAEAAP